MIECKRCGFKTKYRKNLIRHLKKDDPCNIILQNIPREDLVIIETIKSTNEDNCTYLCKFCKKEYINKQSKYIHQRRCALKDKSLININNSTSNITSNINHHINIEYKLKYEEALLEIESLKEEIDELVDDNDNMSDELSKIKKKLDEKIIEVEKFKKNSVTFDSNGNKTRIEYNKIDINAKSDHIDKDYNYRGNPFIRDMKTDMLYDVKTYKFIGNRIDIINKLNEY